MASCERLYATSSDYAHFTGERAPADLDRRLLVRSSRRVDQALIGARYDTDDYDMPTDPEIRQSLRDATCAQAQWCYERGDLSGTGVVEQWDNVKVGDVALSRRTGGTADAQGQLALAPTASDELRLAGLLDIDPWVNG